MGCHTWIYKDIEKLSEKEYKEYIVDKFIDFNYVLRKYLESNNKDKFVEEHIKSIKKEAEEELKSSEYSNDPYSKYIHETSLEYLIEDEKNQIAKNLKIYNFIKSRNRINKKEFLKLGIGDYPILNETYKNKLYIYLSNFGEFFRVCGYPERKFISSSSLIKWLYKNQKKYCLYYYKDSNRIYGMTKELKKKIKNLFSKNKDILINFG